MSRDCSICTHPERGAIDAALVNNEPQRTIAARFSVSRPAVQRHADAHLSQTVVAAARTLDLISARPRPRAIDLAQGPALVLPPAIPAPPADAQTVPHAVRGIGLLAELDRLRARAEALLDRAEADGDLRAALVAIRELREQLVALAGLAADLREAEPDADLRQSPEWHRTRDIIVSALRPHPEAAQAVADALVRAGAS